MRVVTRVDYKVSLQAIKDVDAKQGIVVSYPSTFGVLDSQNDITMPGAFSKTIAEWGPGGANRIKALFLHDPAWPVGRPLSLVEDDIGLRAETKFARTPTARDVLTLIEDGVITEQSYGYDVIKSSNGPNGERLLQELRLWEYSYVIWGANQFTPITQIKSAEELAQRIERFEKALRNGHFKSDEAPHMMQLAINQWKQIALELEKRKKESKLEIKPFAGYDDFADCVAKNQGRDDPEAYCAAVHYAVTGRWPTENDSAKVGSSKEGRIISSANLEKIRAAFEALQALLEVADKKPPKDDDDGSKSKQTEPGGNYHSDSLGDLGQTLQEMTAWARKEQVARELRRFSKQVKEGL